MGAKLEEKVLRSIAAYRQRAGRFLLSFAIRRGAMSWSTYLKAIRAWKRSRRGQPAARQGDRGRSRSSGHRTGR